MTWTIESEQICSRSVPDFMREDHAIGLWLERNHGVHGRPLCERR